MGNKDVVTKNFMQKPEHFADAFNFCFFGGEERIKPCHLLEIGTAEPIILPKKEGEELKTNAKDRDVAKGLKSTLLDENGNPVYDLLLGVENQATRDFMMPVQCALYDFYGLWLQHQRNSKTGALIPYLTLVIHFEDTPWNYPKSVKEMYRKDNVWYPLVESWLPDYKMNLISPYQIQDSEFGKFHSELGNLLWFLKHTDAIKKQDFSDPRFRNVDRDVALTFGELSGCSLKFKESEEARTVSLEAALHELREGGRVEGRVEGESRMGRLIQLLLKEKRYADLERVSSDAVYRSNLLNAYGL